MTKKHIIIGSSVAAAVVTGIAITTAIVKHNRITKLFSRLDDIAEAIEDVAIECIEHTKIIEPTRHRVVSIDETLEEIRNHTDDIASCIIAINGRDELSRVSISIPKEKAAPTLTSDINTEEGPGGPM